MKIFAYFLLVQLVAAACAVAEPSNSVSAVAPSQAEVVWGTTAATFPKLLWEKNLEGSVTSSVISKDGSKIAVADETGKLTLYDTKGEKLWDYRYYGKLPKRTYEFKSNKADLAIQNIEFSHSGKFMICDLAVLSSWKERHGIKNATHYEPFKKICLSSEGKVLWQTTKRASHKVGGDDYVLFQSWPRDESDPGPVSVYLFNAKGQELFVVKATAESDFGFSQDGQKMYIGTKLFETKTKSMLWELHDPTPGTFRGLSGNLAIVSHWKGNGVYDITARKKRFAVGGGPFVCLSENYAVDMGWTSLRVYGVKSGQIVWEQAYNKGELGGNRISVALGKDEKQLLIGSETLILLYDLAGKLLWKQPVKINTLPVEEKVLVNFEYYSVTENAENFLIGVGKSVRLYRAF